jgi:hypothetical protein
MTELTTTMTGIREVDPDELASVEGGCGDDGNFVCGTPVIHYVMKPRPLAV